MTPPHLPKVPEGFEITRPRGPFTDVNGPIWRRSALPGDLPVFGFLAEQRHTNGLGFVHGGMVATFLDSAMAQAIFESFKVRLVTLRLELRYLNVVMRGRWCEAHVELGTQEGQKLEATARLMAARQTCAIASGTFQLFP